VSAPAVEEALSEYIAVLNGGAGRTTRTEDRPKYERHLAAAALMFSALHRGDLDGFKILLATERRAFGWDFLSGEEGSAAEAAWAHFVDFAQSEIARVAV
jgi:hypothetical protein